MAERAAGPPPFEDPFSGDDIEQQIFGTVLQMREPTTTTTIADQVACDPKTARKYLRWFTELGIVTRHDGEPTTYERNNAYFEWRRINHLAEANTVEELQHRVRELTTKIAKYADRYDVDGPDELDAVTVAKTTPRSIDEVYADLTDWQTTIEERTRYERARQQRAGLEGEQASSS